MNENGNYNLEYKVSVLVTFFNQENYVDDALESVFSQDTNFKYKVIVGDDGSTDNTLICIMQWMNKYPERLSYIVQPREKGKKYIAGSRASRNRLALLEQVDTPYFIFLDGDDYWIDNRKLQKQYDILERKENEDCVACGHQIGMFNEKNPEKVRYLTNVKLKEKKLNLELYWNSYYIHTDTILFRSKYISQIPQNVLRDFFNDNLITYTFMQYGKMYYIPYNMVAYRQTEKGIWAGEKKTVSVVREIMLFDLEQQINPKLKKNSMCRHMWNFIYIINNRKEFRTVNKEYLLLAKKYNCETTQQLLGEKNTFSNGIIGEMSILFFIVMRKVLIKLRQIVCRK